VETSSPWLWVVIVSAVVIVTVIGFIVAWWIRKNSSRADRHDMGSDVDSDVGSDAHEDEHINS